MRSNRKAIPIYHGRVWPVGICNAAKRLQCSKGHLQMVLAGKRRSRRLETAYEALVRELKGGVA